MAGGDKGARARPHVTAAGPAAAVAGALPARGARPGVEELVCVAMQLLHPDRRRPGCAWFAACLPLSCLPACLLCSTPALIFQAPPSTVRHRTLPRLWEASLRTPSWTERGHVGHTRTMAMLADGVMLQRVRMRRSNPRCLNEGSPAVTKKSKTASAYPPHDRSCVASTLVCEALTKPVLQHRYLFTRLCLPQPKEAKRCILQLSRLVNQVRWMHGVARWSVLRLRPSSRSDGPAARQQLGVMVQLIKQPGMSWLCLNTPNLLLRHTVHALYRGVQGPWQQAVPHHSP